LLTNTGTILQIIRVEDRKRISTSTDIRISWHTPPLVSQD
jgi:hypothetical protein